MRIRETPTRSRVRRARNIVSPDYFRALRIPLVEGRTFTVADTPDRPAVAIVNQEVARRLWPNESALGKQLRVPRPTTIVGVVGSTRMRSTALDMSPQIYVPSLQVWEPNASIAVRTVAGTAPPIQAIKQAVWSVAPEQAVFNIRSMRELLSRSSAEPRFRTWLIGCFAVLALVLSAAGIFGLVSYLVSRRTREIAIRMAVGAQRRDVYWIVSRQTLASTCTGLVAGLAGAVAANRALGSGFHGVGTPRRVHARRGQRRVPADRVGGHVRAGPPRVRRGRDARAEVRLEQGRPEGLRYVRPRR